MESLPAGWPKTKDERKKLFDAYDNGNGLYSLSELDRMLIAEKCFADFNLKPVIMRAYKKADSFGKREGLITRLEFKKFLEFLPIYKKLWVYFDEVDTNDDRRVDLEEFKKGAEYIGHMVSDPESEFKKIDINGGGKILFDEFCDFFIDRVAKDMEEGE